MTKATVNRECACLSKMFSLAEDWRYVNASPLKKVKRYPEPLKDIKPLTTEQERLLLEEWSKIPKTKHARLIFQIPLYSLMRLSEVLKLRKDSINF